MSMPLGIGLDVSGEALPDASHTGFANARAERASLTSPGSKNTGATFAGALCAQTTLRALDCHRNRRQRHRDAPTMETDSGWRIEPGTRMERLMKSGARTAIALFGGAAVLPL